MFASLFLALALGTESLQAEIPPLTELVGPSFVDYCAMTAQPLTYIPSCEHPNWDCIAAAEAQYVADVTTILNIACSVQAQIANGEQQYEQEISDKFHQCLIDGGDFNDCINQMIEDQQKAGEYLAQLYKDMKRGVENDLQAAQDKFYEAASKCCDRGNGGVTNTSRRSFWGKPITYRRGHRFDR